MSWLRGITSAALSNTAKRVFSPRPNLLFRMISNVRHSPAVLDRAKSRGNVVWTEFSATIQETIDRTAGTAQKNSQPPTPDELWAQRSQSATFNPPADP